MSSNSSYFASRFDFSSFIFYANKLNNRSPSDTRAIVTCGILAVIAVATLIYYSYQASTSTAEEAKNEAIHLAVSTFCIPNALAKPILMFCYSRIKKTREAAAAVTTATASATTATATATVTVTVTTTATTVVAKTYRRAEAKQIIASLEKRVEVVKLVYDYRK